MSNWSVESYIDSRGRVPVEAFFDRLRVEDRARIVQTLGLLEEFGLQLGAPYVKHLQDKLWELRVRSGRKAYRVIYIAHRDRRFILLHAFLKKSRKTPGQDIAIAERRMADFLEREVA